MASRTTTTIIRTTQGSSGGHKRKRSRPTTKPKSRPKARASSARRSSRKSSRSKSTKRFTTTSAQRQAYKDRTNKTNYLPLLGLLGLLGLGGAIFFISKSASASQGPGGQPGQPGEPGKVGPLFPPNPAPPGPNGGGTSPGGHVHPPPGTPATVAVTVGVPAGSQPGLKLRPGPALGGATIGADLPNGAAITVVQSNVPQQGDTAPNSPLRWWQVRTADGREGYVRVIGPENIWNVQFAGRQPATGMLVFPPAPPPEASQRSPQPQPSPFPPGFWIEPVFGGGANLSISPDPVWTYIQRLRQEAALLRSTGLPFNIARAAQMEAQATSLEPQQMMPGFGAGLMSGNTNGPLPTPTTGRSMSSYRPAPRPFAAVANDPFQALVARQRPQPYVQGLG